MPVHMRTQIRDALVAALREGGVSGNSWGSRVFASRRYPLARTDLPAILVYTLEESSGRDTARNLQRQLSVAVEAVTEANGTLDAELDELCRQAEASISVDPTLGGLVYDIELRGTQIALHPGGADRKPEFETGGAAMAFLATYRTPVTDPATNSR